MAVHKWAGRRVVIGPVCRSFVAVNEDVENRPKKSPEALRFPTD
jgi:hypothetical protein